MQEKNRAEHIVTKCMKKKSIATNFGKETKNLYKIKTQRNIRR